MDKTTYVIGHKNPDTDSVVAAAAYAALKRAQGGGNVLAARAGAVNPQTEYIFHRFGAALPEFIPDLIPKVDYYLGGPPICVSEAVPLWEALSIMEKTNSLVLTVVDGEGHYKALLHYSAFAQNMLAKVNPKRKAVIPTSLGLLIDTIKFLGAHAKDIGYIIGRVARWIVSDGLPMLWGAFKALLFGVVDMIVQTFKGHGFFDFVRNAIEGTIAGWKATISTRWASP